MTETISQHAFRNAVRSDAPETIKRLLKQEPDALADGVLLLGTVFTAKPTLRAERRRQGGAGFSIPGLHSLAAWLGWDLRASGGGDIKNAAAIDLASKQPVPVAFRPAFIRIQPDDTRSFRTLKAPELQPFDADQTDHRAALAAWMDRQVARLGS